MYIFPGTSTPMQPLPFTVVVSYSPTMAIGVVRPSTTNSPPPRSVTKTRRLVASDTGQIGELSGRSGADWHGRPFGVVQPARSRVAAGSCRNVSVA